MNAYAMKSNIGGNVVLYVAENATDKKDAMKRLHDAYCKRNNLNTAPYYPPYYPATMETNVYPLSDIFYDIEEGIPADRNRRIAYGTTIITVKA
jgi:hypothetical protein